MGAETHIVFGGIWGLVATSTFTTKALNGHHEMALSEERYAAANSSAILRCALAKRERAENIWEQQSCKLPSGYHQAQL